ncbi:MAG: TonB-dependent receptor [Chlorobi bacterium]|nr:TonB-dependent receptor [Chlorobiota bacterium]
MNTIDSEPVAFANIIIENSTYGTSCNENGFFKLSLLPGRYILKFSAIGFNPKSFTVNLKEGKNLELLITLERSTIKLTKDIVVYGSDETVKIDGWLNSTDDIMQMAEGVSMQRRANFAMEPSIRGLQAGQIGVVVDGMKIFSACVDRMDPVTAYVEVGNLKKMEVSKGSFNLINAPNVGGTINIVTQGANFNRPLFFQAETAFESVSNLLRFRSELNYSNSIWAMRGTFSIKRSNDFYAGNHNLINNSGYDKNNYTFNISTKLTSQHNLEFAFIGDNAYNIGYPALLMDATKAQSQIYRLEYKWNSPFWGLNYLSSKIYFNRIDHWMDDFNRDVSQRQVMTNMYMPMFGKTRTFGTIIDFSYVNSTHSFNLVLDYYKLSAFADMTMISIFDNVSNMYLINIGDAVLSNYAVALDYNWIPSDKFRLKTNLRFDFSNRDLHNEDAKRLLEIFWSEKDIMQNYSTFGLSVVLEYDFDMTNTLQLSLAQSERPPTHVENYGFYLYNYTDNYFYTGNPLLKPEQSRQIEIAFKHSNPLFNANITLFYNNIKNYISGLLQSDEFKIFSNISSTYLTGFEFSGNINLIESLILNTSASYTYGYNREYDEPLPMIPPLEGFIGIQYLKEGYKFSIDSRFATMQKRVAHWTTSEDVTEAFIIFNVRGQINFWNNVDLSFGVENIFDKLYNVHLSINNLSSPGRNIYVAVNVHLGD